MDVQTAILSQNRDLVLVDPPHGGFDGGCVSAEGVPDGEVNADVDGNKGVTPNDALIIQKYSLKLITVFPCEKVDG